MIVRWYSSRNASAEADADAATGTTIGLEFGGTGGVGVSGTLVDESVGAAQAVDESSRLTVKLGSSTAAAAATVNGVPSTGQKLNLSANCSSHLEQNFIDTTSSRLWGSSTDCDSPSAPENSLAKLVSIRLSRTLEGPGTIQRSSSDLSSSSEVNSSGGSNAGSDRKSTRLNSSHLGISYAVFCLKKK